MARWLKQSTSVDVPIGPFVDQTDGFTAETALTITQPDIRLKKNGGNWAQKNASQTLSHEENGWYEVTLDSTDTNTLGLLTLAVNESGALPVWHDFLVVPANVWDSFFASDLLQIDLAQWLGSVPNALVSARVDASVGAMAANTVTASALAADAVSEIQGGLSTLTLSQIQGMIIEGSLTLEQVLRIVLSAASGDSFFPTPGQIAYRDVANTKNRILANVSAGARSAVVRDGT